jgi:hypothetical protein
VRCGSKYVELRFGPVRKKQGKRGGKEHKFRPDEVLARALRFGLGGCLQKAGIATVARRLSTCRRHRPARYEHAGGALSPSSASWPLRGLPRPRSGPAATACASQRRGRLPLPGPPRLLPAACPPRMILLVAGWDRAATSTPVDLRAWPARPGTLRLFGWLDGPLLGRAAGRSRYAARSAAAAAGCSRVQQGRCSRKRGVTSVLLSRIMHLHMQKAAEVVALFQWAAKC